MARRDVIRAIRHLGFAAVVAGSVLVIVVLLEATIADWIRESFRPVTPYRVGVAVVLIGVAAVVERLAGGNRSHRFGARLATVLRRPFASFAALPLAISLAVITTLAAAFRLLLVPGETIPRVLGDELIYSDLAKSVALHGVPMLRGEVTIGYSLLHPYFASPAYLLTSDGAAGFDVLKQMNAVTMALAAIPAYYLARRVVSRGWSLGAATFCVFVPWTEYTALALTEALFYPLFVLFALVCVRMLERPSARRQLLAVSLLLILIGVRSQALVLVGSVLAAIALDYLLRNPDERTLTVYRPALAALGACGIGALAVALAGYQLPTGAYSVLMRVDYNPFSVAKWALWNLAVLELAVGVVALAAMPLALRSLLRRQASDAQRAVGIVTLTTSLGILLSVAVLSASPYGLNILHERGLFYIAPLVVVCFVAWLADDLKRERSLTLAVAAAAVTAAAVLPASLVLRTNDIDGLSLVLLHRLHDVAPGVPLALAMTGVAVAGVVVLTLARSPALPILTLALAFFVGTATSAYVGPLSHRQTQTLAWVDSALPEGETARIVYVDLGLDRDTACADEAFVGQGRLFVWTEFFNTSTDRLSHVGDQLGADSLSSPELKTGIDGMLIDAGENAVVSRFAVVDSRVQIAGRKIARFDDSMLGDRYTDGASLTLWEVEPPLRLEPLPRPMPPRADGTACTTPAP